MKTMFIVLALVTLSFLCEVVWQIRKKLRHESATLKVHIDSPGLFMGMWQPGKMVTFSGVGEYSGTWTVEASGLDAVDLKVLVIRLGRTGGAK